MVIALLQHAAIAVSNLATTRPERSGNRWFASAFVAAAAGVAASLAWTGWPEPNRVFEFPLLMTVALGASFMALQPPVTTVLMQPSFLIEFAALLLLGPNVAMLLAIVGILMQRLMTAGLPISLTLMRIAGATMALQGAGFVHLSLGGSTGHFTWPAQVLPIGAATLTYCLVVGVIEQIALPFVRKQPINPSWWKEILSAEIGRAHV